MEGALFRFVICYVFDISSFSDIMTIRRLEGRLAAARTWAGRAGLGWRTMGNVELRAHPFTLGGASPAFPNHSIHSGADNDMGWGVCKDSGQYHALLPRRAGRASATGVTRCNQAAGGCWRGSCSITRDSLCFISARLSSYYSW